MYAGLPGYGRCFFSSEEGVSGPCQMYLIDGSEAGERAYKASAALTEKCLNALLINQHPEELLKGAEVNGGSQILERGKVAAFRVCGKKMNRTP